MTFFQYLQSRFITSQLALNKAPTTGEHARNQAIRAHMFVALWATAIVQMLWLPVQYALSLLRVLEMPDSASKIALDARTAAMMEAQERAKTSEALKVVGAPNSEGLKS